MSGRKLLGDTWKRLGPEGAGGGVVVVGRVSAIASNEFYDL